MGAILALLGPIIPQIIGAVLTAALAGVTAWLKSKSDQNLGATVEASKVNAATVQVVQAEANAEANAPKTLTATLSSLNTGTF